MEVVPMVDWELEALEQVIEKGMASFQLVGNALMAIRDAKLYRETHDTFEAYCKERWGMVASRARQLIAAAETSDRIKSVTTVTPTSERQTRPLVSLTSEKQAAAWKEAVETAPEGKVTAKHVQEVVDRIEDNVTPIYEKREIEFVETDQYVLLAITQLSKINKHCTKRKQAGIKVIKWCIKNLCGGKYEESKRHS